MGFTLIIINSDERLQCEMRCEVLSKESFKVKGKKAKLSLCLIN
jgi:hypothetical protein